MQKVKRIWIILGILIAILVLIPTILALRFRWFIGPFLSPFEGRVNVLVLGKGGVGHDAPDLTDTMMLASVSSEKTNLISLSRDIWAPEIRAKLNSAYYWGKFRKEGFKLADESVGKITGVNVDYNLVIDFSVFKEVVDSLGGIEVDVQNSFTDEKYPIEGRENDLCDGNGTYTCRYETLTIQKGKQMMDGETALKFVRSRNAEGDEGTDFAREARQQLVIAGIKNKVLSAEVILNLLKIRTLWNIGMDSIETDIPQNMLGVLARKAFDSRDNINSVVIPEEMLINPPISRIYDNQYVFVPKTGNWEEVQKWIQDLLN